MSEENLSEEEKELRLLGAQYGRLFRNVGILEGAAINAKEDLMALGLQIQKLQQQATAKRTMPKPDQAKQSSGKSL